MPYSNVPEELQDKMERCVQKVMADGKEKENAIAICFDAVVGKGKGAVGFTMKMTKTQTLQNGRVRWSARANTGEFDLVQDRFDQAFFDDVIHNFYRVTESLSRSEEPPDDMTEPILDVSHYSIYLPKDRRSMARAGWISKMWRDGRALFAQGFFDDTRLGQIAAKAALDRKPEDRRVSIVVYPDWTLVKMEGERRLFTGGNHAAWLDSIAMTAHPMDPGAQLEVKADMTTPAEDARAVLGDGSEEIIQELEAVRQTAKADTIPADALVKTEDDMSDEVEETTTEVAVEEPVKEEIPEPEEKEPEAATLSEATIKAAVAEVVKGMLPGIGTAIDERLKPIVESVDTLKAEVEVIKTEETAKVAAAIDNDGNWFEKLFGNSVQRTDEGAVKGEMKGPEEAPAGDFSTRYGNQ
jgi:hypothetical protein